MKIPKMIFVKDEGDAFYEPTAFDVADLSEYVTDGNVEGGDVVHVFQYIGKATVVEPKVIASLKFAPKKAKGKK